MIARSMWSAETRAACFAIERHGSRRHQAKGMSRFRYAPRLRSYSNDALPIADVDEALVVHPRDVAHRGPLAALRLPRRLGVLVVAVEHPGEAAHVELPRSPRNHWPAGVVEDGELHARRRAPARARLPQHVLGPKHRVDGELRRAVELPA